MTFNREINSRGWLIACKAEIIFSLGHESEQFFLSLRCVKQFLYPNSYIKRRSRAFLGKHVNSRRGTTLSKRRLCRPFRLDTRLPAWLRKKEFISFWFIVRLNFVSQCPLCARNFPPAKTDNARRFWQDSILFFAREQCGRNNILSFTRLYMLSINNDARHRTQFSRYSISNSFSVCTCETNSNEKIIPVWSITRNRTFRIDKFKVGKIITAYIFEDT